VKSRFANLPGIAIAALVLCIGIVCVLWPLFMSYDWAFDYLVSLYGKEKTLRYFTPYTYKTISIYSKAAGIMLCGVSFLVWRLRNLASTKFRQAIQLLTRGLGQPPRNGLSGHWRRDWPYVVAICFIGLLLRLYFLNREIRYDEACTYLRFASKPLWIGLSAYTVPNNHLFHTLLVHATTGLIGEELWAIRLPALIAGAALPFLSYVCAELVATRGSGTWAAAIVAGSSIAVEYSVNARGYTLVSVFCILSWIALWLGVETKRPVYLAIFAGCIWLGMWTLPTMLFSFVAAVIWFFAIVRRYRRYTRDVLTKRFLSCCILGIILAGLCYLPPLLANGPSRVFANKYVSPRNLDGFLKGNAIELKTAWNQWHRDGIPGIGVIWAVAACLFLSGPARKRPIFMMAAILAGTTFALVVFRQMVPYARVYLFLLPVYAILVGGAFSRVVLVLTGNAGSAGPVVNGGLAVLCCVGLALQVAQKQSVAESTETGAMPGAREVALQLKREGVCWSQVKAGHVSQIILEYYWFHDKRIVREVARSSRASCAAGLKGGINLSQNERAERVLGKGWADLYETKSERKVGAVIVLDLAPKRQSI